MTTFIQLLILGLCLATSLSVNEVRPAKAPAGSDEMPSVAALAGSDEVRPVATLAGLDEIIPAKALADVEEIRPAITPAISKAAGSARPLMVEDTTTGTDGTYRIARVRYRGGGDWYSSPTALTNLLRHMKQRLPTSVSEQYDDVPLDSRELHRYPLLYISGHGNIEISPSEMENLRNYLENGGFLFVDDDYGMDPYVRPLLQEIFPDEELVELSGDHPIYWLVYEFPDGRPPKVHEHDGLPPQAFGLFRDGRLVVLYTYESNPSDGWAYDEHENPEQIVEASLQFGINVLTWVFTSPN